MSHDGNISHKWEHYLKIYEMELGLLVARGQPLNLLEIGIQNGGSLQIWAKYLPPGSNIIGIDINDDCLKINQNGFHIFIGDATDSVFLNNILKDMSFDIIIDDGSHISNDVIRTFTNLFQRLNPSGKYIIEDLHCSYLAKFQGGFQQEGSSIELLKLLIDSLNYDYFRDSVSQEENKFFDFYNRNIGRISFYDSIAVIEKYQNIKKRKFSTILAGNNAPVYELYLYIPRQFAIANKINFQKIRDNLIKKFKCEIADIERQLHDKNNEIAEKDETIEYLINSKSWKYTKPFRLMKRFLKISDL